MCVRHTYVYARMGVYVRLYGHTYTYVPTQACTCVCTPSYVYRRTYVREVDPKPIQIGSEIPSKLFQKRIKNAPGRPKVPMETPQVLQEEKQYGSTRKTNLKRRPNGSKNVPKSI